MKTFFIVLTFVGLALPVLASQRNRRSGRRVFWSGTLIASASAFFIAYPPDWKSAILVSLFVGGGMLFTAYAYTPFLKFRGKVHAFYLHDSKPDPSPEDAPSGADDPDYDPAPDSYGGLVTARKAWWLHILAVAMAVLCVLLQADDKPVWLAPLMATALVILATRIGYGDAIWGYPVARGQRVQFGIIAIISLGVFTILYLGGYYAGKHWPVRRKQSMEYRAHPRHQKKYP